MRCRRAERELAAAVDGQLDPRGRRALDRHLAGCAACRRELARSAAVLRAVAALPTELPVSLALEQRTLRRIRALEDEGVRPFAWWPRVSVPAMALGAALAAVVLVRVVTTEDAGAPRGPAVTPRPQVAAETPRAAGPAKPSVAVAGSKRSPRAVASVPKDPPPELAAAPELFVDLPMLRHLEKLEHFDAILATGLDDAPANGDGGQDRSNG